MSKYCPWCLKDISHLDEPLCGDPSCQMQSAQAHERFLDRLSKQMNCKSEIEEGTEG